MDLSVIIINYNVRPFLENALNSIRRAVVDLMSEIFVVDNASDDGSVEMVREKFPEVKLIQNKTNLGFSAANNIALKQSSGKFIVLLNPDTIVQEDTFSSLTDFLSQNPKVGLVGCKILNPDGTIQLACRRSFPTPWIALTKVTGLSALFPKTKLFGKYNLTYLDPDKASEVDAISGSFMFLKKEVYEQVGGLDEKYFMYGEDLDWCYRVQKSGWKIYYYPQTQIIHYKGESTRRSNIDDLKMFHDAMHIFVKSHLNHSFLILSILRVGIVMRSWFTNSIRLAKYLIPPIIDWVLFLVALAAGSLLRFDKVVSVPPYAILPVIIVPGLIIILTILFSGGYTKYRYSFFRTAISVIIGFTIISALTFFFKQFAFSRIVVVYAAIVSFILLPGWRFIFRSVINYVKLSKGQFFGRKTLIVGVDRNAKQLLQKLRSSISSRYNIVGLIDTTHKNIGDKVLGVEIVGSSENIAKVIDEYRVSDVIFSAESLSYRDILTVVSKSRNREIHFRMVPNSMEVIIGKTHIDQLDEFPLIEIEYKLHSPLNRFTKRLFDLIGSSIMLILFSLTIKAFKGKIHYNLLPFVFSGRYSLVGSPIDSTFLNGSKDNNDSYIPKPGLTGLYQINRREGMTREEIEKYNLYYAKNYSVLLDIEIILKSIILSNKNKKR
ncbi:MAG: glycosyltransferase [Bacteroidota bacterium]|nr:glycosyltransferase [Bacteroidota bacterium]